MPKGTKDIRKLVQRVLDRDDKFYRYLNRALEVIAGVREQRIKLEKYKGATEVAKKRARQREMRLVNGLITRITGSSADNFKALEVAFGDLTKAVKSNQWDYDFSSRKE